MELVKEQHLVLFVHKQQKGEIQTLWGWFYNKKGSWQLKKSVSLINELFSLDHFISYFRQLISVFGILIACKFNFLNNIINKWIQAAI